MPPTEVKCEFFVCCLQKRSKRKKRLPFNYQEVVMPAAVVVSVIFVLTVLIIRAMIYHVAISKSTLDDVSEDFDDGFFVSRKAWGAVAPKSSPIVIPPALLAVVKHTGGPTCSNQKSCKVRVREIQKKHMEEMMFPDIGYNFLIGGDERIYEGRGWGVQNEGRNDSLDLAFIGNFSENVPTSAMLFLARRILIMGRQEGGLDYLRYYVVGHNQTEPTDSPGLNLFKEIKRFNHYSNATCYKNSSLGLIVEYECPPRSSDVDIDAL